VTGSSAGARSHPASRRTASTSVRRCSSEAMPSAVAPRCRPRAPPSCCAWPIAAPQCSSCVAATALVLSPPSPTPARPCPPTQGIDPLHALDRADSAAAAACTGRGSVGVRARHPAALLQTVSPASSVATCCTASAARKRAAHLKAFELSKNTLQTRVEQFQPGQQSATESHTSGSVQACSGRSWF
jgi:hypothetical protein